MPQKANRRGPKKDGLFTAAPFLLPSLLGLLIFSLLPLLVSAVISLTDWNGLDQLLAPGFFQQHFIGLENYRSILTGAELWKVLGNTGAYIVMYIPLMLAVSLLEAYLLNSTRPGVSAFRVVYYLPVLTSWVAASLIWTTVLSPQYGAVNNLLALFGIQGPGWLLDEHWAIAAIVLVSVWKDAGFFGLILLSGMVGINKSYYEAASLDGASTWKRFWRITVPLMSPAIFYVLIVALINAFQLFPQVMIMTDGGPNGATQVMVERIYRYGFRYFRMGYAAAFSWILFAIIMVCTAVQMKAQKRWVNYDA